MKQRKLTWCIVSVTIVAVFCFVVSIPIVNDFIANKMAKSIKAIKLPDNTQYIETFSKAGKLIGSGNGMQYLGGILVKSELPLQDLQTYYSQYAKNDWECIVENQTDKNISFVEHGTVSLNTDISGDTYYVVYSWGDNDSIYSELDLRGH